MTQEQFKKANKTAFTIIIIIFGYLFVSFVSYLLYYPPEMINWSTYLQLITAIVTLIIITTVYVKKEKQNIIIENTEGKFTEVEKSVSDLSSDIIRMNEIMDKTVESSSVISDSISQISAVSEEIA